MSDTIAAVATGGGISAIGIIRISGSNALTAADSVFRAVGGVRLKDAEDRRLYYGELISVCGPGGDGGTGRCADADGHTEAYGCPGIDNRVLLDLCLCTVSRGPASYTGEDTVEFHCHGSPVVLAEVLRSLFSFGVRQALPGEFTKRAFLNGCMDLTQAEAVIDLIESETPLAARNAAEQLRGVIGIKMERVYSQLLDVIAHFHVVVDYPDEDIDDFDMQNYLTLLQDIDSELRRMLETHERGKILRNGIPTAIIGRPNTGKSSLLNALLGYNRAIVTDIAGTTRDTIEEKIIIGNILLRLIDTAGLRKTNDTIEKLGVERTLAALSGAGLVIPVLDGSEPLKCDDHDVLRSIPPDTPIIAVVNKSDLPAVLDAAELEKLGITYCRVSALSGEGLDCLDTEIRKMFPELEKFSSGELITNARQAEAILRAAEGIKLAATALTDTVTPDAVLTDIEAALSAIGEVTGKTMREDIIVRIFERFCVGK